VQLPLFFVYSTYHFLELNFVWVIWCKITLPMLFLVTQNHYPSINHFTDCLAHHTVHCFAFHVVSYHIWYLSMKCYMVLLFMLYSIWYLSINQNIIGYQIKIHLWQTWS
jgi:hypothetical protein